MLMFFFVLTAEQSSSFFVNKCKQVIILTKHLSVNEKINILFKYLVILFKGLHYLSVFFIIC